jgi:NAD(P)-dependent dehydrogenase (short-subunit alcohol dehydrogenase family)
LEHAGKVAIVTGAASGIGRATALGLVREGAAVVIADANGEGAAQVRAELEAAGGRALAVPTDVSNAAAVRRMVERTVGEYGRLDILVCAAGIGVRGHIRETREEDFDQTIAVNLKGVFLCCQAAVPHLIAAGGGRIVNVSSGAAVRAYPYSGAYSASKAGVIALSKALALELAPNRILVNVVLPGLTDTPMGRSSFPGKDLSVYDRGFNPLGRAGQPEDVAGIILMLTKAVSRHMTGQSVHVNGGYYMP